MSFIKRLESRQGGEGEDFAHFYWAHSTHSCWGRFAPKAVDGSKVGVDVAECWACLGQPHIWGNLCTYVPLDVILSPCEALVPATVLLSVSRQPPAAKHLRTGKSLICLNLSLCNSIKKTTYAPVCTSSDEEWWRGKQKTQPLCKDRANRGQFLVLPVLGSSFIAYPAPC